MEFKVTPTSDPIDVPQIAALKDAIADLARRIPDAAGFGIVHIAGGTYNVKDSDRYLVIDARGGPVKIVLQIPKVEQALTIKNGYTTLNLVSVVRTDGKPFADGRASLVVSPSAQGAATNLLCDGSEWWAL